MPVVKTSSKGQLVIPVEIRKKLGIKPGRKVNLTLVDGKAMITPLPEGINAYQPTGSGAFDATGNFSSSPGNSGRFPSRGCVYGWASDHRSQVLHELRGLAVYSKSGLGGGRLWRIHEPFLLGESCKGSKLTSPSSSFLSTGHAYWTCAQSFTGGSLIRLNSFALCVTIHSRLAMAIEAI